MNCGRFEDTITLQKLKKKSSQYFLEALNITYKYKTHKRLYKTTFWFELAFVLEKHFHKVEFSKSFKYYKRLHTEEHLVLLYAASAICLVNSF